MSPVALKTIFGETARNRCSSRSASRGLALRVSRVNRWTGFMLATSTQEPGRTLSDLAYERDPQPELESSGEHSLGR